MTNAPAFDGVLLDLVRCSECGYVDEEEKFDDRMETFDPDRSPRFTIRWKACPSCGADLMTPTLTPVDRNQERSSR